jgi:hypothetical protein
MITTTYPSDGPSWCLFRSGQRKARDRDAASTKGDAAKWCK